MVKLSSIFMLAKASTFKEVLGTVIHIDACVRTYCKWNIFISEIGVSLAAFGVAFLFLGVLLLFDKGLLAIGNVSTAANEFMGIQGTCDVHSKKYVYNFHYSYMYRSKYCFFLIILMKNKWSVFEI